MLVHEAPYDQCNASYVIYILCVIKYNVLSMICLLINVQMKNNHFQIKWGLNNLVSMILDQ